MPTYIKLLKDSKTGDTYYPKTTDTAVILGDGKILSTRLGELDTTLNTLNTKVGTTIDANTLNGKDLSYFGTATDLNNLTTTVTNNNAIKTATITTTWTGSSAPYTQVVNVAGITASMNPIIDIILSSTLATALLEETAWSCISKAVTGAGTITFTCNKTKPVTAMNIQIKGA